MSKLAPSKWKDWSIALFVSTLLGNYSGRFSEHGVIDFIPIPGTKLFCNLADIYIDISMLIAIVLFNKLISDRMSQLDSDQDDTNEIKPDKP